MIKRTSIITALISGVFMLSSFFGHSAALAQTETSSFCNQVTAGDISVASLTGQQEANLNASITTIQNISSGRVSSDNQDALRTTDWQENNDILFSQLNLKNGIDQFKTSINAAETAREASVATAVQNFRTNFTAGIKNVTDSVTKSFSNYKDAVQAALDTTKSNCESVSSDVAENAFNDSLKSAQKDFMSGVKKIEVKQNLQTLVNKRASDIATAHATFTDALNQALSALKAANPQ